MSKIHWDQSLADLHHLMKSLLTSYQPRFFPLCQALGIHEIHLTSDMLCVWPVWSWLMRPMNAVLPLTCFSACWRRCASLPNILVIAQSCRWWCKRSSHSVHSVWAVVLLVGAASLQHLGFVWDCHSDVCNEWTTDPAATTRVATHYCFSHIRCRILLQLLWFQANSPFAHMSSSHLGKSCWSGTLWWVVLIRLQLTAHSLVLCNLSKCCCRVFLCNLISCMGVWERVSCDMQYRKAAEDVGSEGVHAQPKTCHPLSWGKSALPTAALITVSEIQWNSHEGFCLCGVFVACHKKQWVKEWTVGCCWSAFVATVGGRGGHILCLCIMQRSLYKTTYELLFQPLSPSIRQWVPSHNCGRAEDHIKALPFFSAVRSSMNRINHPCRFCCTSKRSNFRISLHSPTFWWLGGDGWYCRKVLVMCWCFWQDKMMWMPLYSS